MSSTVKIHGLDNDGRPLKNDMRFFVSSLSHPSHHLLCGEGSIDTSNILHHLKKLGLSTQKAHKAALKLHVHSVFYAHKLTTTRRALLKTS